MSDSWGPRPAEGVPKESQTVWGGIQRNLTSTQSRLFNPLTWFPPQVAKALKAILLLNFARVFVDLFGSRWRWSGSAITAVIWTLVASIWYEGDLRRRLPPRWRRVGEALAIGVVLLALRNYALAIRNLWAFPRAFTIWLTSDLQLPMILIAAAVLGLFASSPLRRRIKPRALQVVVGFALVAFLLKEVELGRLLASPFSLLDYLGIYEALPDPLLSTVGNMWRFTAQDIGEMDDRTYLYCGIACGLTLVVMFFDRFATKGAIEDKAQELLTEIEQAGLKLRVQAARWIPVLRPKTEQPPFDFQASPTPVTALNQHLRAMALDDQPGPTGAFLGTDLRTGQFALADQETAVLVIGPPRTGKTSSVFIPAVTASGGPVVSTSTKPEILNVVGKKRAAEGQTVWHFDPTGTDDPPEWAKAVTWSPITRAHEWDRALRTADLMVTSSRANRSSGGHESDSFHFTERAKALVAVYLHAVALGDKKMSTLIRWITDHDVDHPGKILKERPNEPRSRQLARQTLTAIAKTERREQSSIFSTAANVFTAYSSEAALDIAEEVAANSFDAERFVSDRAHPQSLFITAPAQAQQQAAPLIVAFLDEIREATYAYHRRTGRTQEPPVLFALDEAANIAPLPDLAGIASEAGGQGLQLMAGFQDLSQPRQRWGPAADGFLSLFSQKLIFRGIADEQTLRTLETVCGDWDRPIGTVSRSGPEMSYSTSWTTQRAPLLTASQIANIPQDFGLSISKHGWMLLGLTPYYRSPFWKPLLDPQPPPPKPGSESSGSRPQPSSLPAPVPVPLSPPPITVPKVIDLDKRSDPKGR